MAERSFPHRVGWIGTGRMGAALADRLLAENVDLWVYNRTRTKTQHLADKGAKVVDSPAELASRDIVFTMVAGPEDVLEVALGPEGVLSQADSRPEILVDSTTIDSITSQRLKEAAGAVGTQVLAAPVSGNPKVVKAGRLTCVVSGPRETFETARPYLECFGRKVTYVGDGDEARLVKICHNLLLGVVTQSMAEITLLAEAAGVSRNDFFEFLNDSVMGSTFTRYKTPAFVNLDFTPTFTWHLLRKDFELGLEAGRLFGVPLPTAALVHELVVEGIAQGHGDEDFASLLARHAEKTNVVLRPENREVDDGLGKS